MNTFFVSIGTALVLAFLAAFIGPHFVDWSSYRRVFESQATALFGAPVRVLGAVEVRLLPTPYVRFDNVEAGRPGHPALAAQSFTLTLAPAPLLRGELHVTELAVKGLAARATIGEDGGVSFLAEGEGGPRLDPANISVERLVLSDATLTLFDRRVGQETQLVGLNAEGDATSLAGPFKAEGGFRYARTTYGFRLSTGRAETGGLRLKLAVTPADRPLSLEVDGVARLDEGMPSFDGRVLAKRLVPADAPPTTELPWRLEARAKADGRRVLLEAIELGYGTEDRRAVLGGTARYDFGRDGGLEAVLSSRRVDLDRLFGLEGAPPSALAQRLADRLPVLAEPPANSRISLDIGGLVAGGGVLSDLRIDARAKGDAWRIETAEAMLPGRTAFRAAGDLRFLGEGVRFEGLANLDAAAFAPFRDWLAGLGDGSAAALPDIGRLEAQAAVRAGPDRLDLDDLKLRLGDASLAGSVAVARGQDGRRTIEARLRADRLDLDRILARPMGAPLGLVHDLGRLALDLDVKSLALGGTAVKGLRARLTLADGVLDAPQLDIADLGGAALRAEGRIEDLLGAPQGRIHATLAAKRLDGVAALATALLGDAAGTALAHRAAALAPLTLTADFSAARETGGTKAALTLKGKAGETDLGLDGHFHGRIDAPAEGAVSLRLDAASPAAARLLGQLGLDTLPLARTGPARLGLEASGSLRKGLELKAEAQGLGSRLAATGTARLEPGAPLALDLALDAQSADALRVAEVLGLALPGRDAAVPARGRARLVKDGASFALEGLDAHVKDGRVAGRLTLTPAAGTSGAPIARAKLDGALELDSADLGWIAGLALGRRAVESDGPVWPDAAFEESLLKGLEGRVDIRTGRLLLPDDLRVAPARFALVMHPNEVEIADLDGGAAGGRLTGALQIRDEGGLRRIALDAALRGARLEELVWRHAGRPVATGTLGLTLHLAGEGRALKALVANASGGGTLRVDSGEIRGLNPQAFDLVLHAADSGLDLTADKVRQAFAGHLAAGVLPFRRIEGAFAVTAGTLRTHDVAVEADGVVALASAKIDLASLTLDSEWSFALTRPLDSRAKVQPPQVALTFRGPLGAPDRTLDTSALQGFLTVRAFEKEVERVEAMQADVLERQRFGRELIRLGEERRRREREARERAAREAEAREARAKAEAAARARTEAEARASHEAERARADTQSRGAADAPLAAEPPLRAAQQEITSAPEVAGRAPSDRDALQRLLEANQPPPLPPPIDVKRHVEPPRRAPVNLVPAPH